jgi:hypothetical protein
VATVRLCPHNLTYLIPSLGVATEGRIRETLDGPGETLSQATFVNALLRYITDDAKRDRDLMLRGQKLDLASGASERRFCFRNMFIWEKDIQIGKIVEQYFLAVEARWPEAWNYSGKGLMLNQSNGFRALMRVFGHSSEEFSHLYRGRVEPRDTGELGHPK